MSEYLSKKALLEWLNEQANNYTGYGHEGTEAIRYIKWRIETSTDFDADDSEIQRLRAALERIVTVYEECDCTAKDLYLIAVNEVGSKQPKVANEVHEALSTTTEPTNKYFGAEWPKAKESEKGLQSVYNQITNILKENNVLMNITPPRPYLIKEDDEERINGEAESLLKEGKIEEYNTKMKEKEAYKLYFDEAYKYTNFYD